MVALLLAVLPAPPTAAFLAAALVASTAIDVDHIPQYLGWHGLTEGAPRPYTHSLITPLALLLVGLLARGRLRAVALGAAVGVCAHLLRDLATASGVSLLWPLSSAGVRVPYWTYLLALVLFAAVWIAHRRSKARRRGPAAAQRPRRACLANTRQAGFGAPPGFTRPK